MIIVNTLRIPMSMEFLALQFSSLLRRHVLLNLGHRDRTSRLQQTQTEPLSEEEIKRIFRLIDL